VHVGRVVHRGRVLTRARAPQNGATPMFVAAQKGHLEVVRALVEAGADITAKNEVSERRVGGEGHMLGQSRDFGEWWQPSGEPQPPAWHARLLSGANR
jgi:hypothetical protein